MANLFIIDEWLYHYLSGTEGNQKRMLAIDFVFAIIQKKDRVLVLRESAFHKKYMRLIQGNPNNDTVENIIKDVLIKGFDLNVDTITYLNQSQVSEVSAKIKKKVKEDDRYLVQMAMKHKNALILTTDAKLCNALRPDGFNIQMVSEYVPTYLL